MTNCSVPSMGVRARISGQPSSQRAGMRRRLPTWERTVSSKSSVPQRWHERRRQSANLRRAGGIPTSLIGSAASGPVRRRSSVQRAGIGLWVVEIGLTATGFPFRSRIAVDFTEADCPELDAAVGAIAFELHFPLEFEILRLAAMPQQDRSGRLAARPSSARRSGRSRRAIDPSGRPIP